MSFSPAEYAGRLAAVRDRMAARGVDVLIVDAIEHLGWLAGWHASGSRYHACLVPLAGEPVMVCRRLDEPAFRERSWLGEAAFFADAEDPVEAVAAVVTRRGWAAGRVGVELDSHYLTVQTYQALRAALPGATFVDFAGVLRELRLRKSAAEIACIRQAAAIADQAMREAIAAAGEGKSEREAAAAAAAAFLRLGADSGRTGPITAGRRSGTLHGTLGDHRLEAGDLLHMELVPSVRGYSARLMRPTVIGPPSAALAAAARALVEIQDEQIAAMQPGAAARDVDRIARDGRAQGRAARRLRQLHRLHARLLRHPADGAAVERLHAGLPAHRGVEPRARHGLPHVHRRAGDGVQRDRPGDGERGPERLTRLERRLFVR